MNKNIIQLCKKIIRLSGIQLINTFSRLNKVKKNKIVVDNFCGRGFGDNPKYIIEELLKREPLLDIVWLVNPSTNIEAFPKNIRIIKHGSIKSFYELATANIWIDNVKDNYKGRKRRGQFYLQTWHGGIGFKKVEKATEKTLGNEYIKASKYDSRQINLMISDSNWVTNNYRTNFWYSGEIAKTGLPRNDVFFHNIRKIKQKVKEFYNLNPNTEIILYAPTFRSYIGIKDQIKVCSFNEHKVIQTFENKFGKKFVLIKRMHPNVANEIKITENNEVKDGSRYPDMQELLVASTALITDYSSCVFDFMLKSNKIFLFARDYNQYVKKDRNLMFNIKKDLPFTFSDNENELLSNIVSFNENLTEKKLNIFKRKVGLLEDGHASERVASLLLKEIHGN